MVGKGVEKGGSRAISTGREDTVFAYVSGGKSRGGIAGKQKNGKQKIRETGALENLSQKGCNQGTTPWMDAKEVLLGDAK